MDRDAFINTHRAALTRIITALIAMAGGGEGRLPRKLSRAVWRILRPAEAAVRRLIVIAAQSLSADLPPSRPFPKGLVLARPGRVRLTFQLFDPRPAFSSPPRTIAAHGLPRVHGFGTSPFSPLFQPQKVASPVPELAAESNARHPARRLAALKMALETLPRQAKRLKRWQVRRAPIERPIVRSPLRPGPPPGHREEPLDEIDWVLMRCHALARQTLSDTS